MIFFYFFNSFNPSIHQIKLFFIPNFHSLPLSSTHKHSPLHRHFPIHHPLSPTTPTGTPTTPPSFTNYEHIIPPFTFPHHLPLPAHPTLQPFTHSPRIRPPVVSHRCFSRISPLPHRARFVSRRRFSPHLSPLRLLLDSTSPSRLWKLHPRNFTRVAPFLALLGLTFSLSFFSSNLSRSPYPLARPARLHVDVAVVGVAHYCALAPVPSRSSSMMFDSTSSLRYPFFRVHHRTIDHHPTVQVDPESFSLVCLSPPALLSPSACRGSPGRKISPGLYPPPILAFSDVLLGLLYN